MLMSLFPQAVLDFHRQVGNVVTHVSDQYGELLAAGWKPAENCSREQMHVELMGSLNDSRRYFAFKEQMKVGTRRWIKLQSGAVAQRGLFSHCRGGSPVTI